MLHKNILISSSLTLHLSFKFYVINLLYSSCPFNLQFTEDKFIGISVGPATSLRETCGICGTQQGELLNLNDGSIATTLEERLAFVSSYRVPAREQSLRPQRTECGMLGLVCTSMNSYKCFCR